MRNWMEKSNWHRNALTSFVWGSLSLEQRYLLGFYRWSTISPTIWMINRSYCHFPCCTLRKQFESNDCSFYINTMLMMVATSFELWNLLVNCHTECHSIGNLQTVMWLPWLLNQPLLIRLYLALQLASAFLWDQLGWQSRLSKTSQSIWLNWGQATEHRIKTILTSWRNAFATSFNLIRMQNSWVWHGKINFLLFFLESNSFVWQIRQWVQQSLWTCRIHYVPVVTAVDSKLALSSSVANSWVSAETFIPVQL